ncbi:hypothetical protein DZF91_02515 [Actinomadura logoneensis]|uniref:Uncharacterized protein n=1 Tax=Actinomadura logoneensis TaxID=2293572 RepID=A0A372JTA7_9ACTN|nr:hypothetical protein [Actinomadura logoneensis]RFU43190.1 hypothetical protein DZF91_02515 [Actinomadura logoneensis]
MSAQDDFRIWERELRPDAADGPESSGGLALLLVASATAAGCTLLITLGEAPLGTAGLVLSSLILLLWRAGM